MPPQQQHAEERGLLGSLCPGKKKLEGKTFYLDSVKKRSTALLLEAISLLGGRVESFLHKDVNFVVTGSQECLKDQKRTDSKAGAKDTSEEAQRPIMTRESLLNSGKGRPGTPRPLACGSRGKALLEKAIRNNEQLQRSSVLANARSWGVKILYVDDVLLYLKHLTQERFSVVHKRPEKASSKQQGSHVVKAAALRSPYLKVEDLSRKYRPLHMQSMTFPSLWYSGRFSPFESPPPKFEKPTEQGECEARERKKVKGSIQEKSQTPISCNPSPWRPRKKDLSYCECCHQPFNNLEEHLQSDQHRAFVMDLSNYSVVDQLVAEMLPGFNPDPPQQSEETLNRPPTQSAIQDICELEPLTDVETEHAVQAMRNQGSSFNAHLSSPAKGPLSCGQGVEFPIPNPASPPADIQPVTADTDNQIPDSHPRSSSPAMPILDIEPQAQASVSQQPHTQYHSPGPDPYSLPPVLSPQVPYHFSSMEPRCLFSDPPVLSPQQYIAKEVMEEHICEMDTAENVFESVPVATVPISTPFAPSGVTESDQESLLGFSGIICSTNGLECATVFSRRSRSLPRQSATSVNPKKRCRSASPECSHSKKRRITARFGCNERWTKQGNESTKPETGLISQPGGCLLSDSRILSSYTVESISLQETVTMYCAPAVQNFTPTESQMDIAHSGTCVGDEPSFPKTSNPPVEVPNDKSHFSSQESQQSHSHSTSVCIESALIPDIAALAPSSSESDWDCDLLSRLGPTSATPLSPSRQSCEVDTELLHRPCNWTHDTSYESRLHTVLQPSNPTTSLCGEEMDPSAFSRTVVQIVEVQH